MSEWQDRIVGARMAVDNDYSPRINNSDFSRQEWGLIMTAVEFDIRDAADDEKAELYADTSNLPEIMPEVENVAQMSSMGTAGTQQNDSGGGFVDSVKSALGLGGGSGGNGMDEDRISEAEELAQGYATELQRYLEQNDSWDEVRAAYIDE